VDVRTKLAASVKTITGACQGTTLVTGLETVLSVPSARYVLTAKYQVPLDRPVTVYVVTVELAI
jgi:hypothetical protein